MGRVIVTSFASYVVSNIARWQVLVVDADQQST